MVYDYSGFPNHLYDIRYDAPGDPSLARQVCNLLSLGGLPARLDPDRGFDHGTFSIMKPLYPDQTTPTVQMSLDVGLDPSLHLAAGRALSPLRDDGVLILGSGMSFHNLRLMHEGGREPSQQFDGWLQRTLVDMSPDSRVAHLVNWRDAPAARLAHPREDHLLPLMTVVGAACDEPGTVVYRQSDFMSSWAVSSYRFGTPPSRTLKAGALL